MFLPKSPPQSQESQTQNEKSFVCNLQPIYFALLKNNQYLKIKLQRIHGQKWENKLLSSSLWIEIIDIDLETETCFFLVLS